MQTDFSLMINHIMKIKISFHFFTFAAVAHQLFLFKYKTSSAVEGILSTS